MSSFLQALYSRATGQLKNVGMLAFMMWMSGSQIHLFSIMMTASGIYQPLMGIVNSGEGKACNCWCHASGTAIQVNEMPGLMATLLLQLFLSPSLTMAVSMSGCQGPCTAWSTSVAWHLLSGR